MRYPDALLLLAAAAALGLAVVERVDAADLPSLPVAPGRPLDAPAEEVAAPAAAKPELALAGSGTRADPIQLDFSLFAFPDYDPPELRGPGAPPLILGNFPEVIAAQNNRVVQLQGYMIAVDFVDGTVGSFVLARFPPGCCFGATPVFDEWVDARPGPGGVTQRSGYEPLAVTGILEVGEELGQEGFVRSLFRLREAEVTKF